ncbi:hypothetical protein QQM39_28415 [Streptomyces sp. DT2A-34]|uniref:hypothetical protein n=1 Tax=Streptomyces sp. DT2A-34 TaxID=3051182 RepID=UPI00265C6ECF|nr:hypothetical protein [Streptomyces sp. DT2A-34]MDO0914616.1 hypothetical protein [Streptomyces sp. DT2A-34]
MATVEAGGPASVPPMLTPPQIELRPSDRGVKRDEMVLRFHIENRDQVIVNALGSWHEYAPILASLGRHESGALVLSTFALRDGWTVDRIAAYDRWPRPSLHASGSALLDQRLEIWPTSLTSPDGESDPRNEIHYDVVVTTDEQLVTVSVLSGQKHEKREGRARIRPVIDPILDLWT